MNSNEVPEEHEINDAPVDHAGHALVIWESTSWKVNLSDGAVEGDGGRYFDDETPLYCNDCQLELTPQEEAALREKVEEAVMNK